MKNTVTRGSQTTKYLMEIYDDRRKEMRALWNHYRKFQNPQEKELSFDYDKLTFKYREISTHPFTLGDAYCDPSIFRTLFHPLILPHKTLAEGHKNCYLRIGYKNRGGYWYKIHVCYYKYHTRMVSHYKSLLRNPNKPDFKLDGKEAGRIIY